MFYTSDSDAKPVIRDTHLAATMSIMIVCESYYHRKLGIAPVPLRRLLAWTPQSQIEHLTGKASPALKVPLHMTVIGALMIA